MPDPQEIELISNIVLRETNTSIEILRGPEVLERVVMGLGGASLRIEQNNLVTDISENGETFLDAVAKKIKVGDRVDDDMSELLANLMAEAVVNAVVRQRPPQISMRLLDSEPLSKFYAVDGYILSKNCSENRMASLFFEGLKGSLSDRSLRWALEI